MKNIEVNGEIYKIPKFEVCDMEHDAFVVICGKRQVGKTSTALSLLTGYTDKEGIIFCNLLDKDLYEKKFSNSKIITDATNFKFDDTYDFILVEDILPTCDKDFIYKVG